MKIHLFAAIGALLGAFPAIATSTAFAQTATEGYIVVAGKNLSRSESHAYIFQQVDLTNAKFLTKRIEIIFGKFGTLANHEIKAPADLVTSLRFAGKRAPAGDYALISETSVYGANTQYTNCFSLGSVIYRIKPEAISLTTVQLAPSAEVTVQAQQVIAGHPTISGPIGAAEVVGVVEFDRGYGCKPRGVAKFQARQAQ